MKRYSSRGKRFLTMEDDGGGSVRYSINTSTYKGTKGFESNVESSMTISDCRRTITLDFDAYYKTDPRAVLRKIDNFIEILQLYREDYNKAIESLYKFRYF